MISDHYVSEGQFVAPDRVVATDTLSHALEGGGAYGLGRARRRTGPGRACDYQTTEENV